MAWPEWNLDIPQEIARFVHPAAALRAGLRPANAGDLADDPPRLVEAIYARLQSERLGYTSTVLGEHGNQIVQTPGEVLEHRTPNCVDLSVLFAATALACDLVPLIAIVKKADNTRHALVWIVPNASTRARRSTDLGPVGGSGHIAKVGVAECAALLDVANGQGWIGIETTGVSHSRMWTDDIASGDARSIDLDQAVSAAERVLAGATRVDLIDVHRLQADGLRPHEPPELVELRRRRRRSLLVGTAVFALGASVLVWSPWSNGRTTQATMTGGFNIALAELDAGENLTDRAREIPRQLAADVARSLDAEAEFGVGRFQVWGPDETGSASADDAAELAASIDADMLVYGTVAERGARSLDVDLLVDATQHSAKAPWPMTLTEEFSTILDTADVEAGTLGSVPSVAAFGFTLDAITALVADRFERADDRLRAAAEQLPDAQPVAMIPALRAWLLLVQAGATSQPEFVNAARPFIAAALDADPNSEFARLVEFSADYLEVIPVPASQPTVLCAAPEAPHVPTPALPPVDDVRALSDRLTASLDSFSPRGQVQVRSLLGRLAFAEQLDVFATTGTLDLAAPTREFVTIIDAFDNSPESIALTIWAADAHGWLGNLAGVSASTPAAEIAAHYLRAAHLATPLFQSRHYASAALVHCTRPDGSPVEAVCLFAEAALIARGRDDDAVERYEAAIAETRARQTAGQPPVECPSDWEVTTS